MAHFRTLLSKRSKKSNTVKTLKDSSVSFLVNVENTFYVDYFCGKNEPNFSSKTFHHFSEDGNRNSFQFKIVCIFERHVNTQREIFRRQIELTPRQRQQQHRPQRQRRRQRWLGRRQVYNLYRDVRAIVTAQN